MPPDQGATVACAISRHIRRWWRGSKPPPPRRGGACQIRALGGRGSPPWWRGLCIGSTSLLHCHWPDLASLRHHRTYVDSLHFNRPDQASLHHHQSVPASPCCYRSLGEKGVVGLWERGRGAREGDGALSCSRKRTCAVRLQREMGCRRTKGRVFHEGDKWTNKRRKIQL